MKNQKFMFMTRDEMKDDNHVFIHLDIISQTTGIPKIDVFIFDESSEPAIGRGLNKKHPGHYLRLPAYLATFLSYQELQILMHWCFLSATETLGNPISSLINYYPQEQAIGLLIKHEVLKTAWFRFRHSTSYPSFEGGHPLTYFLEVIISPEILKIAQSEIRKNILISRLIKTLDKAALSKFIDHCVLIKENKVFNLDDFDYYKLTYQILCDNMDVD